VGQPRDGGLCGTYAIYDDMTANVEFQRAAYGISITRRKVANAGLLGSRINRLPVGRWCWEPSTK
jgi:hypothetical protein